MRHVDHEERADFVRHLAETRPIDVTRIGRGSRYDQLRLVPARHFFHLLIVDQMTVGLDAVGYDLEPLARLIGRRAVGEMAALVQRHAQKSVARFEQRHEYGLVSLRAGVRLDVGE